MLKFARCSVQLREAELATPEGPIGMTIGEPAQSLRGMVIFAHGSGSSRHSPRNQAVAKSLNEAGLATLLLDLLTPDEDRIDRQSAEFRFDIARLSRRMTSATQWARAQPSFARTPIGYFGASTGAAAALMAAAERSDVGSIVSRGGRPDLAGEALAQVDARVLLIVGSRDPAVLEFNRAAERRLRNCKLQIVPGATHLFEEPGAIEMVTDLAKDWFLA